MRMYDSIVIGCGFAGAVIAREQAENGKKVLIVEKRNHIGGNCYDALDEHGILIHQYGPHIFHTNSKKVYDYLSKFTKWYDYEHKVVGNVNGNIIPIPFNLNTLEMVYGLEKGKELKEKLITAYGENKKVPILELKNNEDKEIQEIAQFVYQNIFLKYTMKQWGQTPEEIDASVTARVPVLLSYDNRYFQDTYQGMPLEGYTKLFENMLQHENITVRLNTNASELLEFKENGKTFWEKEEFAGSIIYTGAIDELFQCKYGRLPYRSLEFHLEHYQKEWYQSYGVVNYTVSEDYTRITEFKYLTGQKKEDTTIVKEYPKSYVNPEKQIPYYAIINTENLALYQTYKDLLKNTPNVYLLGRLAEYKYYNIDAIVERALELSEEINAE